MLHRAIEAVVVAVDGVHRRVTGERRRRLADENPRSEECAAPEGGGDPATTNGSAINATREIVRDGTSAYLASLHTSAERFFLNNLLVLGGAMLLVVALHLAAIWALRRRTLRQGHKWHGAPAALAFPSWEIVLLLVGFQARGRG